MSIGLPRTKERETGLAKAREQLAGYPDQVRGQFEFLLQVAQVGIVLSEDHGFWIDFQMMHRVGMVMVEVGRRLAEAGMVAEAADAFHLGMAELRDALATLPAERKADIERNRELQPPMQLGTDYGPGRKIRSLALLASFLARRLNRLRKRVTSSAIPVHRVRSKARPR